MRMKRALALATAAVCAWLLFSGGTLHAGAEVAARLTDVDTIFKDFTASTPGCAVGVSVDGAPIATKAYGMADLEHDVTNTAETIFEVGSVSKQFTAAAVLLLARDGKLSLDDPIRKYIPEVPDYGTPITIRHILAHTSGLRDWGSVAGIGGWPRTSRAYTHANVLDIVSRQKSLNFAPGTHWSYTNTGYNLAAILVERVSGQSFSAFTRARLFEPLGMTHTSWRDDYTRIVKGRAMAYSPSGAGFRTNMPFENAVGNGGLLTTVGDLLKWNENFWSPKVGDAAFVADQQRPVTLASNPRLGYGMGLMIDMRQGVFQIDHGGTTAGYLAELVRYPEQHVSVAVACNTSSANATSRAYQVADLYLSQRTTLAPLVPTNTRTLTAAEIEPLLGLYRSPLNGRSIALVKAGDLLRIDGGSALFARSATSFVTAGTMTAEFDGRGHGRTIDAYDVGDLERVPAAKPTAQELAAFARTYASDEAEIALAVSVENGALVVTRRPGTKFPLTPVYQDAFSAPTLNLVIFRRDASGRVNALSVVQDRVWDLRFARRQ